MDRRVLGLWGVVLLAGLAGLMAGCARGERPSRSASSADPDSVAALIMRDRPERWTLSLSPPGSGEVVMLGAQREREAAPAPVEPGAPPAVEPPLPGAEPALPPESAAPSPHSSTADPSLKPPIPRGLPLLPEGGRGGRVALDVRVDEQGEVTDAQLVETDADSATVAAAIGAAYSLRFHPAILGEQRVAVWTRQVFQVKRSATKR